MIFRGPKEGDTKYFKKFSWLPTTIVDEETKERYTIWMMTYYEKQVYEVDFFFTGWLVYRKLTPYKIPPKLEIVK